jgi:hypothetical protein
MALLSERQQKAAALARELQKLDGVWVTNPMPLDDNARGLRVQILDSERQKSLTLLEDWGWTPTWCSNLPRVCTDGWKLASVYEIDLPRERQPVADGKIQGEIANREEEKKNAMQVALMRKHLGLDK